MTLREHMKKYHPEKAHYQMLPCNCADYQHMLNRYCERTDCENCWNQEYIPKEGETMETKKYIIEIPEDTAYLKILRVEGPGDIVYVKDLEEYSPLKEKLAVEARQSGYDAGRSRNIFMHLCGCRKVDSYADKMATQNEIVESYWGKNILESNCMA